MWLASVRIVTIVIGSGVLSLVWAIAQLGWAAGPAMMQLFTRVVYTPPCKDEEAELHIHGHRSFQPHTTTIRHYNLAAPFYCNNMSNLARCYSGNAL
jgi:hypothetical protein